MFVMQLIGRQAETVIDMPYAEATACIGNGTVRRATEEQSTAPVVHMTTDQLMAGYRIEPFEGAGFNVFDAGGVKINQEPLRNQLVAQEFVVDYSRRARGLPDDLFKQQQSGGGANDDGDVNYDGNTVEELQRMAADRGIDSSGASRKADWVKLLKRDDKVKAALAAREFDTLTVDELKTVAVQKSIDLGEAKTKPEIVAVFEAKYQA
jgi:hypothetical protein